MAKEAIGIKNYRTYSKTLTNLIDWGFLKLVQKSKNQYSSNIIAIVENTKAHTKALDKALQKHSQKQRQSIVSIDIQETIKQETRNNIPFEIFWNLYDKKTGKSKSEAKWNKLTEEEKKIIIESVPKYVATITDKQFQKDPLTYLNGRHWEDEISKKDSFYNPFDEIMEEINNGTK